jgi:hypothetical protein
MTRTPRAVLDRGTRTRRLAHGHNRRALPTLAALAAAVILLTGIHPAALAVQPETWTHTAEADFADGDFDAVVVTNLGDVQLATRTRILAENLEPATVVYDLLALPDGSTLLAVGPEARLLRHDGDDVTELLSLPGEQVFALAMFNGKPLVAISGPRPRLALLDGPDMKELTLLAELPTADPAATDPNEHQPNGDNNATDPGATDPGAEDASAHDRGTPIVEAELAANGAETMVREDGEIALRYVWDMIVDGRRIYLATGPQGRVLRVDLTGPAPAVHVLLVTGQSNVLCLARDARGRLFAGTDGEGLVLRIDDPRAAEDAVTSFVVYDAAEPEIAALLAASDGNLYIGTADAEQARPGRLERPSEQSTGRTAEPQPTPADDDPSPDQPHPDVGTDAGTGTDTATTGDPGISGDRGDAAELSQPLDSQPAADAGDDDGDNGSTPPQRTPRQRDALREVMRQRLLDARRTGAVRTRPGRTDAPTRAAPAQPTTRESPLRAAGPSRPGEGNAVYRLDSDGFVTEVMRESVMILALVEEPRDDEGQPLSLLVATGNEGQLFRLTPQAGEVSRLAKIEAEQITTLLRPGTDRGATLLAATANPAKLLDFDGRRAADGRYTSRPLDAGQIALWGMMHVTASTPPDTTVAVQTRSGNVSRADDRFWSPWTEAATLDAPDAGPLAPRPLRVESPPARFVQYRLLLTGDGQVGPSVGQVQLTRVVPNLPPKITSLTAKYARDRDEGTAGPRPQFNLEFEWEAADPNNDKLRYTLEYRPATADIWLPLAEDITETRFTWDTRRAPDGRYVVRLTASDAPDNPGPMALTASRLSDPIVVDNTPPRLESGPTLSRRGGTVTITATFVDDLSPIREVRYAVNATDEYQPVLTDDLIYDSTRESVTITIAGLSPGPHVVVLRATDAQGNALLHAVNIPAR